MFRSIKFCVINNVFKEGSFDVTAFVEFSARVPKNLAELFIQPPNLFLKAPSSSFPSAYSEPDFLEKRRPSVNLFEIVFNQLLCST